MREFGQRSLQFLRFLRGKSITNERDRIKRGLIILALSVVVGAVLMGAILAITAPKTDQGVALLSPTNTIQPTPTPTTMPTPTSTPVPSIPAFSHIFEIVLENTSYEQLIGNTQAPYFNAQIGRAH